MAKINQYPAKTVPSNNDEFVLHDPGSGSTKKMTRGDLIGGAPLPPDTVDEQAIADGSVPANKTAFGGNYSTSEVNTGFKWVDNKDIYKKTINFGSLPNNTSKQVAHGTSIDKYVKIEGIATDGSTTLPIPNVFNSLGLQVAVYVNNTTQITILTGSDRSSYNAFITIYYTKP